MTNLNRIRLLSILFIYRIVTRHNFVIVTIIYSLNTSHIQAYYEHSFPFFKSTKTYSIQPYTIRCTQFNFFNFSFPFVQTQLSASGHFPLGLTNHFYPFRTHIKILRLIYHTQGQDIRNQFFNLDHTEERDRRRLPYYMTRLSVTVHNYLRPFSRSWINITTTFKDFLLRLTT